MIEIGHHTGRQEPSQFLYFVFDCGAVFATL